MIDRALKKLLKGRDLTEKESREVFTDLFLGKVDEQKSRSLLLLLSEKGETAGELNGCLEALRKLEPPFKTGLSGLIDTCGTGGDGSQSINVSTLAAIVAAGAGARVAKHGNRAISSKSGSSDLLKGLGVTLEPSRGKVVAALKRSGVGYFHAPFHHPVFARVQPLRRSLKTRTIFNLLGPLVNPVALDGQLVGVSTKRNLELFANVLKKRKLKCAMVCHARDGMDEISAKAPTDYVLIRGTKTQKGTVFPSRLGVKKRSPANYRGGSIRENVKISRTILEGSEKGGRRDLVVLNAAAALLVSGRAATMKQGMLLAEDSIDSGKALNALTTLKKVSRAGN